MKDNSVGTGFTIGTWPVYRNIQDHTFADFGSYIKEAAPVFAPTSENNKFRYQKPHGKEYTEDVLIFAVVDICYLG